MNIIQGGEDAFTAIAFGSPNPQASQYWANQINQVKSMMGERIDHFTQGFVARAQALHERFAGSRAVEIAKAALNQIKGVFQPDVIRFIDSIQEFQIATPVMQRYLMAEPTVRKMYHQQRCDGYSDTYVDHEPGLVGDEHYDYRRVMNGAFIEGEENSPGYFSHWAEDLREGDEELSGFDQMRIRRSWDEIAKLMLLGAKDPTSPWNNDL